MKVFLTLLLISPLAAQIPAVPQAEKCTIEGTVTKVGDGTPLAKVEIVISKAGVREPPLVLITDASGGFVAHDLDPGRYSLRAERNGYVAQEYGKRDKNRHGAPLALMPGQKLQHIDFRLVPTGVVTGHVFGDENEPRPGVQVQALTFHYREGRRRLIAAGNANTNDLGEYRIYGLPPGRYYILAEQDYPRTIRLPKGRPEEHYVPTLYPGVSDARQATSVSVQPAQEVRGIDIATLRYRTFHIRGKILGVDRTALYPRVELRSSAAASDILFRGGEWPANDQGSFDPGGILPGSYVLSASFTRDGKAHGTWQRIEVGNADLEGVSLAPSPGMDLPGRVRSEGDKPLVLVNLSAHLLPTVFFLRGQPGARVNPDGSFLLRGVGRDAYRLGVSGLPDDFYLRSVRLGDVEATNRSVDLTGVEAAPGPLAIVVSSSGGRIDGVVKNEKDEAASGATVVLVPHPSQRRESYLFKATTADQQGRFTIRGIAPGEYKLFAWEDVEPSAWEDPEFLKAYEEKGEMLKIGANGHVTRDLRLIPADMTFVSP